MSFTEVVFEASEATVQDPPFIAAIQVIPVDELCKNWVANRTIMLRMTSKRVKEIVDKLYLPVVVCLHKLTSCKICEDLPLYIMYRLINFSYYNNIEKLTIQYFRIKTIIEDFSKVLEQCKKIKELDLSDGGLKGNSLINAKNISPDQSANLVNALNKISSTLISLNLKNCSIGNEIKNLNLKQFSGLTSLNLGGNNIGFYGNGVETIARIAMELINCKGLTYLNLDKNNISNYGAENLFKNLSQCSSLVRLDLSMNCIHFYDTDCLVKNLSECTTISHLDLSYNWIKPEGAVNIAKALKKLSLTHLNLSYNSIESEGALSIMSVIQNTSLTHLDLRGNFFRPKFITAECIGRYLSLSRSHKESSYLI